MKSLLAFLLVAICYINVSRAAPSTTNTETTQGKIKNKKMN
jgi:hypothetical protein